MRAIVLAAGRGSRMGERTNSLPKCRTVFHGKELINWQLDALNDAEITEIALVRGYLGTTFEFNLTYFENQRWHQTNMLKSLMVADSWLREDECIVSYSDIIYSGDAVKKLVREGADIAISYDPDWLNLWSLRFDNPLDDAESFRIDSSSNIIDIGRRVEIVDEIQGQFMGLLKITPAGWAQISDYLKLVEDEDLDSMDMTGLLQNLIANKVDVKAIPIDDQWLEVDTESDLMKYNNSTTFNKGYLSS